MSEKKLHQQVCDYIKYQYPAIIFTSDASGLRVSIGVRNELKRKRCAHYKIPDLLILHPVNEYKGLFIEIKKSLSDVFRKDGSIKADIHVIEQKITIDRLNELGYKAAFGCGFEHCKAIIDNYFNQARA